MFDIPFLDLPPLLSAGGTVRLPGSKSISNRVLLLAGLSAGSTLVHDLLDSDDTQVMLTALRALGCEIEWPAPAPAPVAALAPDASTTTGQALTAPLRIGGIGGRLRQREATLFLGNAGTAMRPLTAALALLAATQGGRFELSGVPRMHERPIGDLIDALRPLGCRVDYLGADGYPPLRLSPGLVPGFDALRTDAPIRVRGDVSSQFLTALLMALPLVAERNTVVIEVDGELISRPYIEITLNLLARFGIAVQRAGWQRFTIPAGSAYRSTGEIRIEADASSASYFIALGAIAATAQPLRIEGVGTDSIQGDIRFVDAARAMGADIRSGPGWIEARRGRWPLAAIDLDCNHIPDAAMTLAMMALYADGTTRLANIASWRVKETDRIAAMSTELRQLGAAVTEGVDFIAVSPPRQWRAPAIATYDDHRMAMCFSLAALNGLSQPVAGDSAAQATSRMPPVPVRILDPKCVGKTFPDYFETLFSVVQADTARVPVIAIDGPSASGKGTVASAVAGALGYHFLDSGAVYRATALAALQAGVDIAAWSNDQPADTATTEQRLGALAATLDLVFDGGRVRLGGVDVTEALRAEPVAMLASRVSAVPAVRDALRRLQLSFRRLPGLVADGRDMGTVIFPDADLKIFMTASAATRAARRHGQLKAQGISANIDGLRADLEARDERDKNRAVAPLKPAGDAVLLDNSALTIDQSVAAVLQAWEHHRRLPNP